jgi:predicted dehydrogenase
MFPNSPSPLRVAIVGTSRRSDYLYGPLIQALPEHVQLVSVWGRSEKSARALGESLGAPWYLDLDRLVRETAPEIGIVSVGYSANGQVSLMALEAGLHVLVETPIAHKLAEADAMIAAAEARGLHIEVAEQFHRRPIEQIKLKLIEAGLFGRVYSSFNDFEGHGYHGVSVMRSYLGFDKRPLRVSGAVREFPLAAHWARNQNTRGPRNETQEHGLVEFEAGLLGVFHWTNVGYDSGLRWWRSARFLAEKGMGVTLRSEPEGETQNWLSLLAPGGEGHQFITIQRRLERNDGGALVCIVAHTGDSEQPIIRWDNPFLGVRQGHGPQWHDDEIAVASCLMSLVNAVRGNGPVTYGAHQGRLDQEIILAIRESSRQGRPVDLPLDPAA